MQKLQPAQHLNTRQRSARPRQHRPARWPHNLALGRHTRITEGQAPRDAARTLANTPRPSLIAVVGGGGGANSVRGGPNTESVDTGGAIGGAWGGCLWIASFWGGDGTEAPSPRIGVGGTFVGGGGDASLESAGGGDSNHGRPRRSRPALLAQSWRLSVSVWVRSIESAV
jgi:hypothetical protein